MKHCICRSPFCRNCFPEGYPYKNNNSKQELGWQKCPICNGVGIVNTNRLNAFETCNICNGEKIINIKTGLPPTKN